MSPVEVGGCEGRHLARLLPPRLAAVTLTDDLGLGSTGGYTAPPCHLLAPSQEPGVTRVRRDGQMLPEVTGRGEGLA